VTTVAPRDNYVRELIALGATHIDFKMDAEGTNPFTDARLIFRLYRLIRESKPDVVINYTIKPVIYGAIAARFANCPVISVVPGLGVSFARSGILYSLVSLLYRVSQTKVKKVFLLNDEDENFFRSHELAPDSVITSIPGEGIDTEFFSPINRKPKGVRPVRFILTGRMLRAKGVEIFVSATRILREEGWNIECALLGFVDVENPSAIDWATIENWVNEGIVQFLGSTKDVRPHLAEADVVVLPSFYKEGLSRSLLEAAAMAKPIITSTVNGCRQVVNDNVNGFLCLPNNVESLVGCMRNMLLLSPEKREEMGQNGRRLVIDKYRDALVVSAYHRELTEIFNH